MTLLWTGRPVGVSPPRPRIYLEPKRDVHQRYRANGDEAEAEHAPKAAKCRAWVHRAFRAAERAAESRRKEKSCTEEGDCQQNEQGRGSSTRLRLTNRKPNSVQIVNIIQHVLRTARVSTGRIASLEDRKSGDRSDGVPHCKWPDDPVELDSDGQQRKTRRRANRRKHTAQPSCSNPPDTRKRVFASARRAAASLCLVSPCDDSGWPSDESRRIDATGAPLTIASSARRGAAVAGLLPGGD